MAKSAEKENIPPPRPENGALAAFLSYLVPGLGQIYQGRIGKGILFFVCIYALFFFGQWLGSGTAENGKADEGKLTYSVSSNVFLPHTAELNNPRGLSDPLADLWNRPHFLGQVWVGVAAWPAIFQYMRYDKDRDADPPLGGFQRQPPEWALNVLQVSGDKTWDLAWVYTVVAGVLNIMVIYDAAIGPAFVARPGTAHNDRKGPNASPAAGTAT
jgi:TM2 domain-containing membrane protein YozV